MRDDFSTKTIETLARRVGYRCSNPDCPLQSTSGPHEDPSRSVNIGVAAHITAASKGGPRYDGSLTPAQRRSITNGIWLCQNCAKLIDSDALRFTVEMLRRWKEEAEAAASCRVSGRPERPPVVVGPAFASPHHLATPEGGPTWARILGALSPRYRSWLVEHAILPQPPLWQAERAYLEWFDNELSWRNLDDIAKVPLRGRPRQTMSGPPTDYRPGELPSSHAEVQHIRCLLWELKGTAEGGDQATAQLAAANRGSRLVRNVVNFLEKTRDPVVILGDPGSGKSTTLRDVGIRVARRGLVRIPAFIPVYVPLGAYNAAFDDDVPADVLELIVHCIPNTHPLMRGALQQLIDERRLVVLFDGMDEMGRGADRLGRSLYTLRVEKLSTFARDYAGRVHALFACRTNDFSRALTHRQMVLLEFSRHQIFTYIRRNFNLPIVIEGVSYGARRLAQELLNSDDLVGMAANPLTLYLIRHFTLTTGRWPSGRKELFATYIDSLLHRLDEYYRRAGRQAEGKEEILREWSALAFEFARECGEVYMEVGTLRRLWGDDRAARVLDTGLRSGSLTVEFGREPSVSEAGGARSDADIVELSDGDSVGFFHHRLQEYLAAYHLNTHYETEGGLDWDQLLDSPRWQETLINLVAIGGQKSGAFAVLERTLDEANAAFQEIRSTRQVLEKELGRIKSVFEAMKPIGETGGEYSSPIYSAEDTERRKKLYTRQSDIEKELENLSWRIPSDRESTVADRIVLTAHLIGEAGPSAERVPETLRTKLALAASNVAELGRPTSQVKMLWAWKSSTDVIPMASFHVPLHSSIAWVRNQAILARGTLAARRKQGAGDIGDDLALDFASGDLLSRVRTYWKATEARPPDRVLLVWTVLCYAGFLVCAFSGILVIAFITAKSIPDSFWQSVPGLRKAGWGTGFLTIAGAAAVLTAAAAIARGPGLLRLYSLFVGLVSATSIAIAMWKSIPIRGLVSATSIAVAIWNSFQIPVTNTSEVVFLYDWVCLAPLAATLPVLVLPFLFAFSFACLPSLFARQVTIQRCSVVLRDHRNWYIEAIGGCSWLVAGYCLLLPLLTVALGIFIVVSSVVMCYRFIKDSDSGELKEIALFTAISFVFTTAAVILIVAILRLTAQFHGVFKRVGNVLLMLFGIPLYAIIGITILFLVLVAVTSWAKLIYGLMRYYAWRLFGMREPELEGLSCAAWLKQFTNADAYTQASMLIRTSAKTLGLSPREFLKLLQECERNVKSTPAGDVYWPKRHELEESVKQERSGQLQQRSSVPG